MRISQETTLTFTFAAALDQLEYADDTIIAFLHKSPDMPDLESNSYTIVLAIHELITNIIKHAYAGRSDGTITLGLTHEPGYFEAILADSGCNFEVADVAQPNLENGQVNGYGIFLMNQLMDEVDYQPHASGNRWRLVKRW